VPVPVVDERRLVVGEQRPGVAQHDRVVVDVDHAGGGLDLLGDLVHVLRGGQAGTDVEQLPDARLADQVADHAPEDVPLGAHAHLYRGQRRDHLLGDGAVGGEVVLAAEKVVVDPGDVRLRGVERVIRHQPMLAGPGPRDGTGLPGPSSLWFDARGRRFPAPHFPGFDSLGMLGAIRATGFSGREAGRAAARATAG
jgi:hypothetical protein